MAYQTEENGYHARSFEDAFINENLEKLEEHNAEFDDFNFESESNIYELTKKVLKKYKKSDFAAKVLYLALTKNIEWNIPKYIKNGLEWILVD